MMFIDMVPRMIPHTIAPHNDEYNIVLSRGVVCCVVTKAAMVLMIQAF